MSYGTSDAGMVVEGGYTEGAMEMGSVVEGGHVDGGTMQNDSGFDLQPGEVLVPGSVQTTGSSPAEAQELPSSSSDAAPAAAEDAAPPAPSPDAQTDA